MFQLPSGKSKHLILDSKGQPRHTISGNENATVWKVYSLLKLKINIQDKWTEASTNRRMDTTLVTPLRIAAEFFNTELLGLIISPDYWS